MSLIKQEIDNVFLDEEQNIVILEILDDMDWSNETEHLELLQNKLNLYIHFIDTKQLYELHDEFKSKDIGIAIHFKYTIPMSCRSFIEKARDHLNQLSIKGDYKIMLEVLEE